MSYESSVSKLPFQLKDLVVNAQADVGKTDADKEEVARWIETVAEGEVVKPAALPVSRRNKSRLNCLMSQDCRRVSRRSLYLAHTS